MREGFDRRTLLGALGAVGCGFRPAIARAEAYTRPYGPNAPWNVPAASVATHPQSALYAERLWSLGSATPGNVNLTFAGYTYPVYDVREATLEVTVSVKWRTALHGTKLPWNPAWKIPSGSDRQVILLDPPTGREWNLWQVSYKNGRLSCTNGNLVPGTIGPGRSASRPRAAAASPTSPCSCGRKRSKRAKSATPSRCRS